MSSNPKDKPGSNSASQQDISALIEVPSRNVDDRTESLDVNALKAAVREAKRAQKRELKTQKRIEAVGAPEQEVKSWTKFALIAVAVLVIAGIAYRAFGDEPKATPEPTRGEPINIEKIKEKYWNKGEDAGLRVVQNRTYSKAGALQLGLFGGTISTDPFLSVKQLGVSLGYHFNEFFGLSFLTWKEYASNSSAYVELQGDTNGQVAPRVNRPSSFLGGEGEFSPIYGKLSLLGKAIIYYDLHLLADLGETKTETGSYFTPAIGIGQQVFINKMFAVRLDYRKTYYHEHVTSVADRDNWSDVISLGATMLIGGF